MENIKEKLNQEYEGTYIPVHIQPALINYIEHKRPTGSFLRAVLENNLREAFAKADGANRRNLFAIVAFLYLYAPGTCWGSPEKVRAWLKNNE